MPTIKDVAKLAGVSISTVSYALNGTGVVSEETKNKILEAAQELNYKPNAIARSLKKKKQQLIAVIVRDFHGPVYGEIIRGIRDASQGQQYEMIVAASYNNKRLTKILTEWMVDGAIILDANVSDEEIKELASQDFHIVALDRVIDEPHISSILIDNEDAVYNVVKFFHELGYSDIGFIGGPKDSFDNLMRLDGFKRGIKDFKLNHKKEWFTMSNFTEQGGYEAISKHIQSGTLPRAYFVANDEMAIGAMKALHDAGKKVPEDVAVIGFDDIQLAEYVKPALTTVRRPCYELGVIAGNTLIGSLNDEKISKSITLSTELIVRESCHSS